MTIVATNYEEIDAEIERERERRREALPLDPSYTRYSLRDIEVCRSSLLFIEPYRDPFVWKALFVFDLWDRRGLPEVHAWCRSTFGEPWPGGEGRWHAGQDSIAFVDDADAFLFKIRWG